MYGFVIGPQQEALVATMVKFANDNILEVEDLDAIERAARVEPSHDPRFTVEIPNGYELTFALERQPDVGLVRHLALYSRFLSIPPIPATGHAMKLCGFDADIEAGTGEIHFHLEDVTPDRKRIHIFEPVV